MATTREDVLSWRGQNLVDNDGDKIGKIDDIYLDQDTNEPEWAVVTTGLFGTKQTFVPIADASATEDGVRVPYEKSQVKDAPRVDPDGRLSHDEERQLYQHYGRDWGSSWDTRESDTTRGGERGVADRDVEGATGGPGRDTSGPNTD